MHKEKLTEVYEKLNDDFKNIKKIVNTLEKDLNKQLKLYSSLKKEIEIIKKQLTQINQKTINNENNIKYVNSKR